MDRAADQSSPFDRIVVRRGQPLSGTVKPGGAKNSVLKLMAASLLAEGHYELTNVPGISDVGTMGELLGAMGVTMTRDPHDVHSHLARRAGHRHSRSAL